MLECGKHSALTGHQESNRAQGLLYLFSNAIPLNNSANANLAQQQHLITVTKWWAGIKARQYLQANVFLGVIP